MERKDFIKNNLLATGVILLPNAIWAFDKKLDVATKRLNKFVSKPNLKKFKVSEIGTKFFETELSIVKPTTNFSLHRKYFISENLNGICTPTLLETNHHESLVFIPELYKDKKNNGFIVKVCENGLCEETKIFTHENQGYYAFWGKEYLGNPTLYHYNIETFHLMRMHKEHEQWINHRVMPIYPDEMIALYQQQLKQVEQGQLTQQFGYDFEIHKDGFYQFLSLKNDWEQSIITKEKEAFEKDNPAKIFTTANELVENIEKEPEFSYTNPFVPIYCKGDDLSYATIKPTILYEEIAGTKIEIPNMPAYKTQDDMSDCVAFAIATILQKRVCEKWKEDIPDCKNPPADSSISYFGLMIYTNQADGGFGTIDLIHPGRKSAVDIINDLAKSGNKLILESCKPFDQFVNSFNSSGQAGIEKRDIFFNYLKKMYLNKKNKTEADISDCLECITEINKIPGLNANLTNLKKALTKDTYDKFLYSLFFDGCKLEDFPSGFSARAYPDDSMNVTPNEIKNKVIDGLNQGKPVLYANICTTRTIGEDCEMGHTTVISGYKRLIDPVKKDYKDVLKVHNSWGVEWQIRNNDGWVDADTLTSNTMKVKSKDTHRISSGSVIWLDP